MTNIFTNFSSPVTSGSPVVPVNNSKTTVQDDKAIKKAKRMEVVKTVAPIAVCAITIPITADPIVPPNVAKKNFRNCIVEDI